jgi:hypothetical protein
LLCSFFSLKISLFQNNLSLCSLTLRLPVFPVCQLKALAIVALCAVSISYLSKSNPNRGSSSLTKDRKSPRRSRIQGLSKRN